MGVGRPYIAPKYSPEVPRHFPHQGKPFPDFLQKSIFWDPQHFGTNTPRFVDPSNFQNLSQDLDIDCIPNLSDPHRVVDNTLLYRHFYLRFFNEFMRSELSHFPFPNLVKSTFSGWGQNGLLFHRNRPSKFPKSDPRSRHRLYPEFIGPP